MVDRLAQEVFLMARVAVDRLQLLSEPTDIVLGGGVLASRQPQLINRASERIRSYAPLANVVVVDHPPVVGAALLGLDALGAPDVAGVQIRNALLAKIRGSAESVRRERREQGVPLPGGDLVAE